MISNSREGYYLVGLEFLLPRRLFDFVLRPDVFELFYRLPAELRGKYRIENDKLFFEFMDLKIRITSKSDLYILNEIFIEECYRFLMPGNVEVHVVDVGMNVGFASLFFAGQSNVKRVYSFEPFIPTFTQALNNFELNPSRAAKIEPFNFGLGSGEDEISAIYDPANSGISTSLVCRPNPIVGYQATLKIKPAFETLNAIFNACPSATFILKIDTEGAEYEIFESLFQKQVHSNLKGVMLEWHFHGAQKLEQRLLKNGFSVTSIRLTVNSGMIYAFR